MRKQETIIEEAKNWAESTINYYDSDDFKGNYMEALSEDLHYNYYSLEEFLKKELNVYSPGKELLEEIAEHVNYNSDDFISDFNSYYVGNYCIASVSFGEQGEEIPEEFLNSPEALKEIENDFYVSEGYAYYDISSEGIKYSITPDSPEEGQIKAIIAKHNK